ncbi:MAG: Na+/H+ antiporter NhaA, partial [Gammaproteobacteria bacterium]|nr:Na+/H+ antiporter NhaA [Gammaproteobacteria bacterium]
MKKNLGKEYSSHWEKAFDRLLSPLEEFIHRQTTSGILLMVCAILALYLANSQWSEAYQHFLHIPFSIGTPSFQLSKSILHWINDGLMALFFLLVGLELKREILFGELANFKQALFPIIAAIGGMVVPVLIYISFNPEGHAFDGWGVPMATDIAFALGTLALLGNRIPKSLLTFLVALAIVDDLGAVIVIALFYTETINTPALLIAVFAMGILVTLNLGGIRHSLPYLLLGIILWVAMLKSGVHATLAGVFLAFTIPMRPKFDAQRFISQINKRLKQIKTSYKNNDNIINNSVLRTQVRALGDGVQLVQAPAQILEQKLHLPSAYFIIPIFALANAGIHINFSAFLTTVLHPISLGIAAGLVLGKLIGIAGFTWVAVQLKWITLPSNINFKHIIGVGFMGGIGFTMSIFIAELGFAHSPEDLLLAKTGVLIASLIAGISGFVWLYIYSEKDSENDQ